MAPMTWIAGRVVLATRLGVVGLGLAATLWLGGCSTATPAPTPTGTDLPEKALLERQKLAAEVRSIEASTAATAGGSSWLIRLAPFLTVLVASGTLLVTVARDRSAARAARLQEKATEASEARKRHDEAIATTVQNMGAGSARLRLNASAALAPVLRDPDTPRVAEDLLPVIVANLRAEDDPGVVDVLVNDLGLALRQLAAHAALPDVLDLSRTKVRRLRISGLSLGLVDVAFARVRDCDLTASDDLKRLRGFGADLSGSRFSRSNLHEARLNHSVCYRTQFHDARLVSATFKSADLTGAQFQRARLQGAHFEDAVCLGAAFTDADVADTWFCDSRGDHAAVLDRSALSSLARARNWRRAHLAPIHRTLLDELSTPAIRGPGADE
jgi:hypothetical protein